MDCFTCKAPMIVWLYCKEPGPRSKLRALKEMHSLFGANSVIRGTRTKYDHPHEHILLT